MDNETKNRFRKMRRKKFLFAPLMIGLIFGLGALVMVLWNAILPDLLGVSSITYWQAMGLLILCKILFGGFGPRRCGPRGRFGGRRAMMRRQMGSFSEEERQKFREEFRKRC